MLSKSEDNNAKLLKEIDQITYRNSMYCTPFDALLIACILYPEKCIKTKREHRATVELQGLSTRGQMVLDRKSTDYNVTVIELMHQDEFEKVLKWTATA